MTRGTIDTFRKLSTYFFPISKQSCPFRKSMPWDQIRIKSQCVYSRQWRLSNLIPPEVKVHRHSSHCPNDGTITKQFFALQFYSDNSKFIFLASGPKFLRVSRQSNATCFKIHACHFCNHYVTQCRILQLLYTILPWMGIKNLKNLHPLFANT